MCFPGFGAESTSSTCDHMTAITHVRCVVGRHNRTYRRICVARNRSLLALGLAFTLLIQDRSQHDQPATA